ncbi:hypothetical protein VL10_23695 [Leclercia adecarboxylata]|nr:hypothetical protein VL10_23695 [Leclercia adecarboxylata]KMN61789.1 hypothetical protein VK95_23215 [Leclercia sp. LK8]
MNKLLTNHPYLNVVGQCCDGLDALALCKKLSPSLVIIDPDLVDISCSTLIRQLQRHKPDLKFIIFFHEKSQFSFDKYIHLGIHGLVLKSSHPNTLLSAILAISRDTTFMDSMLTPAFGKAAETSENINPMTKPLSTPKLSPRQKQILILISQGFRNKEIASKLVITCKTVESHRLNLMKKLGAHNIVDLIKWANRLNLL